MSKKKLERRVEDLFEDLQNGKPVQIGDDKVIPLKEEIVSP